MKHTGAQNLRFAPKHEVSLTSNLKLLKQNDVNRRLRARGSNDVGATSHQPVVELELCPNKLMLRFHIETEQT